MAAWIGRAKQWARSIKRDVLVVWLIAKDRRTPWGIRILAGLVAAYALSPIDLIPDFVPVLGYLDDLLIIPIGILAVLKLMPPHLLEEHRRAATLLAGNPVSRFGLAMIVTLWILAAAALWLFFGNRQ